MTRCSARACGRGGQVHSKSDEMSKSRERDHFSTACLIGNLSSWPRPWLPPHGGKPGREKGQLNTCKAIPADWPTDGNNFRSNSEETRGLGKKNCQRKWAQKRVILTTGGDQELSLRGPCVEGGGPWPLITPSGCKAAGISWRSHAPCAWRSRAPCVHILPKLYP